MNVNVNKALAKKLNELAAASGRAPEQIVEDALASYLDEVASLRTALDTRYDELKSGTIRPIDGEAFFDDLRRREGELLKRSQ